MPNPVHLSPRESVVLVIDVQEKLMAKIPSADAVTQNIAFLLDTAKLLDVEIAATEQYPKGLGPTVASLAQLYLGNILYAIELAALALQDQGKVDDAAYYRAIARKLADAHGKAKLAAQSES